MKAAVIGTAVFLALCAAGLGLHIVDRISGYGWTIELQAVGLLLLVAPFVFGAIWMWTDLA